MDRKKPTPKRTPPAEATEGVYTTPDGAIRTGSIHALALQTTAELVEELLRRPNVATVIAYTTDQAINSKDVADKNLTISCGKSGLPSVVERLREALERVIEQD